MTNAIGTKLKDVLHLYLGCEVLYNNKRWRLWSLSKELAKLVRSKSEYNEQYTRFIEDYTHIIKPILRPLSDMKEDEKEQVMGTSEGIKDENSAAMAMAAATRIMLSKHFDLFNLIESGQAIDATTIPGF